MASYYSNDHDDDEQGYYSNNYDDDGQGHSGNDYDDDGQGYYTNDYDDNEQGYYTNDYDDDGQGYYTNDYDDDGQGYYTNNYDDDGQGHSGNDYDDNEQGYYTNDYDDDGQGYYTNNYDDDGQGHSGNDYDDNEQGYYTNDYDDDGQGYYTNNYDDDGQGHSGNDYDDNEQGYYTNDYDDNEQGYYTNDYDDNEQGYYTNDYDDNEQGYYTNDYDDDGQGHSGNDYNDTEQGYYSNDYDDEQGHSGNDYNDTEQGYYTNDYDDDGQGHSGNDYDDNEQGYYSNDYDDEQAHSGNDYNDTEPKGHPQVTWESNQQDASPTPRAGTYEIDELIFIGTIDEEDGDDEPKGHPQVTWESNQQDASPTPRAGTYEIDELIFINTIDEEDGDDEPKGHPQVTWESNQQDASPTPRAGTYEIDELIFINTIDEEDGDDEPKGHPQVTWESNQQDASPTPRAGTYEIDELIFIDTIDEEDSDDDDPNGHQQAKPSIPYTFDEKVPLDFIIYEHIVKHLAFRCIENEIYIYDKYYGCYENMSYNKIQTVIRSVLDERINQYANQYHLKNVLHRIATNPEFQLPKNHLDQYPHLINFQNGVLDTQTMRLMQHSPDFNFTYGIKIDYKEDIFTCESWFYSRFFQFMKECTKNDTKKIAALQEMTGYFLSNYIRAKKMFVIQGAPHTGKSVWMELWESIIGTDFTTSLDLKQITDHKFMTIELMHSRLNLTNELDPNSLIKGIDRLKAITGGDKLTGEKKGKDPIHFYTKAKLVIACNVMPLLNDIDSTNAMIDRLFFISFPEAQPIEKRDLMLIHKLKQEQEVIVAWAVEGLNRLIKNNFQFTEPDDSIQFKKQYIAELNPIPGFISQCCTVDPKNGQLKVHRTALMAAYHKYCKENDLSVISRNNFYNQIRALGVKGKKIRINGSLPYEGFEGISLK